MPDAQGTPEGPDEPKPQGEGQAEPEVIFVADITLRNGRRIYAAQYGLKGFPIKVKGPRS